MKFKIKHTILLQNLSLIGKFFITPSVNIAKLGNILCIIPSHLKFLKLICINLEMEMSLKIYDVEIYQAGSSIIYGKKLFNICKNMPRNDSITVELKQNKIIILSHTNKFVLNSLNIDVTPQLANLFVKDNIEFIKVKFSIQQDIIYQLLHNTYFSMPSLHDYTSVYNGLLLELKKDSITSVTLDGRRLSICSICSISLPIFTLIITQRTVHELLRIFTLNKNQKEINLTVIDNYLKLDIENMSIITQLIPSYIYPDYKNLGKINDDDIKSKILIINTQMLKESCVRIASLKNEQSRKITFVITTNLLKILSQNTEYEEAEVILPIKYEQEDINISLNVEYIIDALNTISTEEVKIIFTDEFTSLKLTNYPINTCTCTYIIMPII